MKYNYETLKNILNSGNGRNVVMLHEELDSKNFYEDPEFIEQILKITQDQQILLRCAISLDKRCEAFEKYFTNPHVLLIYAINVTLGKLPEELHNIMLVEASVNQNAYAESYFNWVI